MQTYKRRLLQKGESLCCFRDSASVTYGGMLPSDLTLSALRFILSAKSRQSCKQDCETVDFCNSLKRRVSALILTASILLSCGTRRHHFADASQQRSELAVSQTEQHLRDTTLEEWELLLLDSIPPSQKGLELLSGLEPLVGDSLPAGYSLQTPHVRYIRARRAVVKKQDSIVQQGAALRQGDFQQEEVTERQTASRRPSLLTRLLVWVVGGGLLVICVTTFVWSVVRRLQPIIGKYK